MKRMIRALTTGLVLAIVIAGCSEAKKKGVLSRPLTAPSSDPAPIPTPTYGTLTIAPTTSTLAVNNNVTFTAAGGDGAFTYTVESGGGSILSTTGAYTAPATSGAATVRVTDGQGSTADATITINDAVQIAPTNPSLSLSQAQTFTATGGVPPLVFSVNSGDGSVNASTGVFTAPSTPGSTVVRVTDSLGNYSETTADTFGALGISPESTTITISNTVDFNAAGGQGPYTFSVVSGGGTIDSAGIYTPASMGNAQIKVTDNLGNISTAAVTINDALAVAPTNSVMLVNGSLTFTPSGGVEPYSFSISSGGGSIDGSGVYTAPATNSNVVITLTDAISNSINSVVTVTSPMSISPSSKTLAVNNSASFIVSGGTLPYSYSVVSGGGTFISGTYMAPASSGSAVIRVTDSLGATVNVNVTINPALAITPASIAMGVSSGLTFSASGGVAPYTYSVTSGTGTVGSSSGAYVAPANPGSETVRATDSLGNTADSAITINAGVGISPAAITLAVNNTQTFTAAGGSGGYTFSVVSGGGGTINSSTGAYTAPATPGTYDIRVTDTLDSSTSDATVTVNAALAISPTNKTMAVNNTFTFTATGGVSPYAYSIVSGSGNINSSTGLFTAAATTGSVTVRVTDGKGNTSNSTVTVSAALVISPTSVTITTADTKTFSSSGGASPYTYTVLSGSGSIATATLTPSASGTIVVRSTDAMGNTSDSTVTVNTALTITSISNYIANGGDLQFSFTGGVPPVTYSVTAGSGTVDPDTGTLTATGTGSITVRATDSHTSAHTSSKTVTSYTPLSLDPTLVTIAANGTQTFTGAGGQGTLSYTMVSGTGSIDVATGVYTAPGTQGSESIKVSDTLGNTVTATITVVTALTITPATLKLPVYSTAVFSAVQGTAPYVFSIGSGNGTINSSSGVYTADSVIGSGSAVVTDANTITSTAAVTHLKPVQISAEDYHFCARYNDGSVKCWGRGSSGQLGHGSTGNIGDGATEIGGAIPFVNLGTGLTAKAITSGRFHNCAILNDDTVKCWGQNTYGQLGIDSTTSKGTSSSHMGNNLARVNLGTGRTATKIFSFGYVTCVIMDNSQTKCWGDNQYSALGLGTIAAPNLKVGDVPGDMAALTTMNFGTGRTATKIAGGLDYLCALLDDASVKCYGRTRYGQVGKNITSSTSTDPNFAIGDAAGEVGDSNSSINFGSGVSATDIFGGYRHVCIIDNTGGTRCWGRNVAGELGLSTGTSAVGDSGTEMANITPIGSFSSLGLGRETTCGISGANTYCWGQNNRGQLLTNGTTDSFVTTNILNISTTNSVVAVNSNLYGFCAIFNNDRIKCWGEATYGEMLNASTTNHIGDGASENGDNVPWVNH